MKITQIKFCLIMYICAFVLAACGGGGGAGEANNGVKQAPKVEVLATTANEFMDFAIDNGNIYLNDSVTLKKIAINSGAVRTLFIDHFISPSKMVNAGGKLFFLDGISNGGLYSIDENNSGVTPLLLKAYSSNSADSIATDGSYIYWTEGSTVFRYPFSGPTALQAEKVYQGQSGYTRVVLDNGTLYVADSGARKIFSIRTSDLSKAEVISISGTPTWDSSSYPVILALDKNNLYALVDNKYIHRINKAKPTDIVVAAPIIPFGLTIAADQLGAYWWENNFKNFVLKRIDSASGQISTLATIPFSYNLNTFVADGAHVYWHIWETDYNGNDIYKFWRVAVQGGVIELVAQFSSADGVIGPSSGAMNQDGDNLYWSGSNAIIKLKKSGGTPEAIPSFETFSAFTVLGQDFVAVNRGGVFIVPFAGQRPATSEWAQKDGSYFFPLEITSDGSYVYWTVEIPQPGFSAANLFDIYSMPIAGGATIKLASVSGLKRIYAYNGALYLIKNDNGYGVISSLKASGGAEKVLISGNTFKPADMQIMGGLMYISADGIYALNESTGKIKGIADRQNTDRIYVDSTHVYWTETGDSAGLYRTGIDGGIIETLDSGNIQKLAGDFTRVYWVNGRKLLSIQK